MLDATLSKETNNDESRIPDVRQNHRKHRVDSPAQLRVCRGETWNERRKSMIVTY
jgi:hypothetical protein